MRQVIDSKLSEYEDMHFNAAREYVRARLAAAAGTGSALFTARPRNTGAEPAAVFLDALPPDRRQHHDCACCRAFLNKYGTLVTINERGAARSALFGSDGPGFYRPALAALTALVDGPDTVVAGAYVSSDESWGTEEAGGWTHFHTPRPRAAAWTRRDLTAGQRRAALLENHRTLVAALGEWKLYVLERAVNMLRGGALYRADNILPMAEFLLSLKREFMESGVFRVRSLNIVWRAVARAPDGWCTPRSGMVGTLLDDIAAGLPDQEVARRFKDKMHPLQYQRPQAAPRAGTLDAAEKLVEQMGVARSLERRYARLDELQLMWSPPATPERRVPGNVFAGVEPRAAPHPVRPTPTGLPPTHVSWAHFQANVLPRATELSVLTQPKMDFIALTTAVHPDAPPILQWDEEGARNPVAWYRYHGGSQPERWGLSTGMRANVLGALLPPSSWHRPDPRYKGVILILKGAHDQNHPGLALFPETLKSSLHPVRAVVEAFSARGNLGPTADSACGVAVGGGVPATVHALTDVGWSYYVIDRWD